MIDPTKITDSAFDKAKSAAPVAQRKLADTMSIMGEVRMVGAALVLILLFVFVLTEIYDAVEVEEGPFSSVADDLENIGATALGLLVIALLVVAASAIMRFFGQSGFGGR